MEGLGKQTIGFGVNLGIFTQGDLHLSQLNKETDISVLIYYNIGSPVWIQQEVKVG